MTSWPIIPTLRGYRAAWLGRDLAAGLTLAGVAVPEQVATAGLAGAPAWAGLYAFVAGSLMFAVLGRHPQLSVGADSTIAPLLAAAAATVGSPGSPPYVQSLAILAVMVGLLVTAVGLLRLGWVSQFLSTPVVTGVLAGIAVQILVRQLPAVLGVPGEGTNTIGRLRAVAGRLGHTNGWAVAIAAFVLAVIVAGERLDRRIPGALLGVIGSTVAVAWLGLGSRGVETVGPVQAGLPTVGLPSAPWSEVRHLLPAALVVTFLCVIQTAATERGAAPAPGTAGDFDRDLVAVGAGSLLAGLGGSFAVNASPPRTAIVVATGGRTQVCAVVAAGLTLGFVTGAAGVLRNLPQAALGAILVFVASRLLRITELRTIRRFDRLEYALAVVTTAAVALVGVEQGVIVAMVLALADRTWRAARPADVVLGREPGTDHWIPVDVGQPTEQVPGVVVYLLYGPLWYGNADHTAARIRDLVDAARSPVHAFVLDAGGISDIDYTAAQTLRDLLHRLRRRGVTVGIARSSHLVHHDLVHAGLLAALGPDRLFMTVEDAVVALAVMG
ncbi:sulfate permease-like transporter, MFS superfamily [Frankia torreyi]|uniref:Sulfate permease-like transporter, MFS superfamily n=1 Tax=Frankia torreyi TaxID=1856 RepID=A0A0D8BE02_9ACTN|nr:MULTISPECIES: SulP family inorganic anion transporter [Frankia]KJE22498.1 sulfate permease-like transporter, MFS superfamily [Frankia torreyi]KQM04537.1 sulfate permease-like transporter, MFS superfamily [Frankia sp. CpI1-P]